jgi:hypothetical protein
MKSLITCGKININIIYIIVPVIITILEYFYAIDAFVNIYQVHTIIFKIIQALAMSFSFIPFIISKRKNKSYNTIIVCLIIYMTKNILINIKMLNIKNMVLYFYLVF